jgi:PAS domain-containing protein
MDRASVTALFGEDVKRTDAVIGAKAGLAGAIGNALAEQAELAAVFAGANVGLALFDRELKLLACNTLYRDLCGYRPNEIVAGAALTDLMRISLERQNKPEDLIERTIALALGRLEPGSTYTFRYSTPSARTVEVIRRMLPSGAIVETVRELGAAQVGSTDLNTQFEQIAEAARQRMMHALDVMADGFALFYANDRLTVYNRKFVETKPRIADLIVPGLTYENMLRQAIARGQYVFQGMSNADYLELRLNRHRNPGEPFEVQLCDGRWIKIDEQRTADGGIVGTRSDITEMKNREFDLLRISHQLHAKNAMFDTALNNMIQGLCMFDANRRLIVCNRRYLELYGFSAEVVKPGIELSDIMRYSVSLGN